jgi:hypothetical protein
MYKQSKFIFAPTKNYIFTNNKITIERQKPKFSLHKLSPTQKNFNFFRPVKPFSRFIKHKIYNSGIDPSAVFINFIKKDPEKSRKRNISPIITKDIKYIPSSPHRWVVGCTKSCNHKNLVPKYDPFKEYHFNEKSNQTFEKSYLPTDHISIREPKIPKTIDNDSSSIINNSKYPYLKLKGEYNNTSDSNSFWVPRNNANKTTSNKSSVDYNIISNNKNNLSVIEKDTMLNKTLYNKRKGIEEFVVSQRPFGPNYNQTFIKLIKENGKRFRKYKGMFTELYDSATKNGNIFKPFHERKEDEFKNRNNKSENQKYH